MSQITLDSIANLVRNTVKEEVTEIKEKIKFLPTKDEFYSKMDELMGEMKSMREEVAVVTGYKDQIENHETRISKLEEALEPNPASS